MRLATDIGGTFTDLVIDDGVGPLRLYKSPTVPADPVQGLLDVLELAAVDLGYSLSRFLSRAESLAHGTTHAINAVVTSRTARTAFLTTEGHADILLLREGGRTEPFNHTQPYPEPYVPRSLTFEVRERIDSDGSISLPLDLPRLLETIEELRAKRIEAVAVCLLWSVVNPVHEIRIGELLSELLRDVPFTLSHALNPVMREYRRASATAIDASLKPLMGDYLCRLKTRLRNAGFGGNLYMLTSQGGVRDVDDVMSAPIHVLNSGPAMAPVAGRHYARKEGVALDLIVADTGGTTYDVSLVRDGRIPRTRETWIGPRFLGHMTGFPSVDVRNVGTGGGSIAWIDEACALHVGPLSAGADPGPACYAKGGVEPTVTDAALVLGYLDAESFLGGRLKLDALRSRRAIETKIAIPLGMDPLDAAWAILAVATENMVQAILDITVNQGIDPARAALIGGGGAAGLNALFVARRLGCPSLLIPQTGAALSATGALLGDLRSEFRQAAFLTTEDFDQRRANEVLNRLTGRCESFIRGAAAQGSQHWIEYDVDARYRNQVWDIEAPLQTAVFENDADVTRFTEGFHETHERIFGVRDPASAVEIVNWSATACCRLYEESRPRAPDIESAQSSKLRTAYFPGEGVRTVDVYKLDGLPTETTYPGPALVECPFTTVVIDSAGRFQRSAHFNLKVWSEAS